MKRWLPFILLITVAVSSTVYLLGFGSTSEYKPQTSNPKIIFKQACAECHGQTGDGALLYPALSNRMISEEEVMETVQKGAFLMPAFPHITDSTLEKLAKYVADRGYEDDL